MGEGSFWSHFTPKLGLLTVVGSMGGFLFGYDTGIVSGAMIFVTEEFDLSHAMHELVVSITLLAAAGLPLTIGFLSRWCGRKTLMAISATLFSISSCVIGLASNVTMLLIGRFIVGCAIGLLSTIGPVFISECAPTSIRGALVTFYSFSIIIGQVIAYLVALALVNVQDNGWRYMFGLGAVPAILQIVGLAFLPESPRYLLSFEREEQEGTPSTPNAFEAFEALSELRPSGCDVRAECEQLKSQLREQGADRGMLETFLEIWKVPHVRRALLVGCGMQMFQQLVGINTVLYYCSSIVQMAGVSDKQHALLYSAIIMVVYSCFASVLLFIIDSVGRRKLLIISSIGVTLGLLLLMVSFILINGNSPTLSFVETRGNSQQDRANDKCAKIENCNECALDNDCGVCYLDLKGTGNLVDQGSCVEIDKDTSSYPDYYSTYGRCDEGNLGTNSSLTFSTDSCPNKFAPLIIIALIFYLNCFGIGYGQIPWVYNSEIYPQWARSTAVSIATTTNWTFNLIISVSFLSLVDAISQAGSFAVYAVLSLISVLFFFKFMPETKGVPLEKIEKLFGMEYEPFSPSETIAHAPFSTDEE
ncbi:proton myo-inositol cotransporter-like [Convolutriloba macropyga]|uniref:proton myo-inositol cotransporter-like n=1 Tax=Convolutriloba macropyga TaxID=536237 RepID=UPI003F528FE7